MKEFTDQSQSSDAEARVRKAVADHEARQRLHEEFLRSIAGIEMDDLGRSVIVYRKD